MDAQEAFSNSSDRTVGPSQSTDSTGMNREKLLARIRKLYAMSGENESSPHEAEIAMRRCQSLMNRFGVTESDLETSEFGTAKCSTSYRAMPSYIRFLGAAVAVLHDCICARSDKLEFRGFSIDAEVAPMTFDYLTASMERSLKERKRNGSVEPGRSASFDYRLGFAMAVVSRVKKLDEDRRAEQVQAAADAAQNGDTGSSLVVRKMQIVRSSCSEGLAHRRNTRIRYWNGLAHRAGCNDGSQVSLNRQIGKAIKKSIAEDRS